jgi:hypothetical protein
MLVNILFFSGLGVILLAAASANGWCQFAFNVSFTRFPFVTCVGVRSAG